MALRTVPVPSHERVQYAFLGSGRPTYALSFTSVLPANIGHILDTDRRVSRKSLILMGAAGYDPATFAL